MVLNSAKIVRRQRKRRYKIGDEKKKNFFELNFSPLKQNFFELFFLVSYSKLCEV
jgi:hypothetical protein